jgi:hypothetical protein
MRTNSSISRHKSKRRTLTIKVRSDQVDLPQLTPVFRQAGIKDLRSVGKVIFHFIITRRGLKGGVR